MFVYLLTNTVNGKYYVGKTTHHNLRAYLNTKKSLSIHNPTIGMPVVRAMAKYGFENFTIDILATPNTVDSLDTLEKLWIILLGSRNQSIGYNICIGGKGFGRLGIPHTEETKKKMSLSQTGHKPAVYVHTKEQRIKQRESAIKISPEVRKKQATSLREFYKQCSPEWKKVQRVKMKNGWDRKVKSDHTFTSNMTKEQRVERARKAIRARWNKHRLLKKEEPCSDRMTG